jgi:cytochrome c oxidase cbb3-type subunit II
MSFRTFILGLAASFGVAWLAVVVIPFFKMRALAPIGLSEEIDGAAGVYIPKRAGRIAEGALVYAENGCYLCHTQVVRPDYAGNDIRRPDWGGLKLDADRGDTRRETNAFDFIGERFAQIGVSRMGPDLSNLGRRVEAEYAVDEDPAHWLYAHLYDPRMLPERRTSTCPSFRFLFKEREIKGNPSADALDFGGSDTTEIVPGDDARALVSYLLSLKKDHAVPAVLNFAPVKKSDES